MVGMTQPDITVYITVHRGAAITIGVLVSLLVNVVLFPDYAHETLKESGVQAKTPAPSDGKQYLDPEQMREFVTKVSEAIRKASVEPHLVGFRPDPDSRGYLIEIRKPDGTLVTTFAPEKVLNLHGKMDDLSGMVIDLKT